MSKIDDAAPTMTDGPAGPGQTRKAPPGCPVADFDHLSEEFRSSRTEHYAEFIEHYPPVFYTEHNGGHWVVTGFEEAKAVFGDHETFSCKRNPDGTGGRRIPPSGFQLSFSEMDPPEHDVFRKALWPKFSRSGVQRLRPLITEVLTGCIDRIIEQRDFDVVSDLAATFPPKVMLRSLGFDEEQERAFAQAIHDSYSAAPGQAGATDGFAYLSKAILDLAEAKRSVAPDESLMSHIVHSEELRPELDEASMVSLVMMLLLAGFDTTRALISYSVLYLDQRRDLRARLAADSSLIPGASEEFARHCDPTGGTARNITHDIELGGVTMRKGDRIFLALPAIGRDPRTYEHPNELDIDREGQHLAYGVGIHFCLGIWLARQENNMLIEQLLARVPDYSIDQARMTPKLSLGSISGFETMPATTNL